MIVHHHGLEARHRPEVPMKSSISAAGKPRCIAACFAVANSGSRNSGEHNGQRYDDEVIVDTRRRTNDRPAPRPRTPSPPPKSTYDEIEIRQR